MVESFGLVQSAGTDAVPHVAGAAASSSQAMVASATSAPPRSRSLDSGVAIVCSDFGTVAVAAVVVGGVGLVLDMVDVVATGDGFVVGADDTLVGDGVASTASDAHAASATVVATSRSRGILRCRCMPPS